jgi:hypothetical protein
MKEIQHATKNTSDKVCPKLNIQSQKIFKITKEEKPSSSILRKDTKIHAKMLNSADSPKKLHFNQTISSYSSNASSR